MSSDSASQNSYVNFAARARGRSSAPGIVAHGKVRKHGSVSPLLSRAHKIPRSRTTFASIVRRAEQGCLLTAACALGLAAGAASASETVTYGYDALGRLTSVTRAGGPSAAYPIITSYDPAGNRTNYTVANAPAPPPPGPVSFSISNAPAVDEGGYSVFTITKTGTATTTQAVNYATSSGSATSGSDFTATSGTLSFLWWETQRTVAVPILTDSVTEPAETFAMSLSAPSSGATIGTSSATGTINPSSAPNQPPTANADTASVGVCDSVTISPLANDTDPEGNYPLTLVSVGHATLGTAGVSGNNVNYGAGGRTGREQITYTVKDSLGATSSGTITITILSGSGCL
jgi:YD repeat-containing protein